jgi:uncharacterized protein (TIGR03000 family)
MYSVVMVMALAGSAEAPDCHGSCGCQAYAGCYGGRVATSCGCFGGRVATSCGCFGGRVATTCGCFGGHARTGCYGGGYGGCYGTTVTNCGCYGGGGVIIEKQKDMPKAEKIEMPKGKGTDQVSAPATIVVNLPAEAKLTIDGYVSRQTSSQRTLVTIPIEPGREFTYTFVAEVSGSRQTQTVTVRGGQTAPVNFDFGTAPVAASR